MNNTFYCYKFIVFSELLKLYYLRLKIKEAVKFK